MNITVRKLIKKILFFVSFFLIIFLTFAYINGAIVWKIKDDQGCEFNTIQEQYIYDRTFSICAIDNYFGYSGGTFWVVDRIEKNNNPYEYWFATNWHVKLGMDKIISPSYYYACVGKKAIDFKINLPLCYYKLFSLEFDENDFENFLYQNRTINKKQTDCYYGIDLYVCKVNFGDGKDLSQWIRTKLDKLNSIKKNKGFITEFISPNDWKYVDNQTKWVGGYQALHDYSFGLRYFQWKKLCFSKDQLIRKKDAVVGSHEILLNNFNKYPEKIIDCSPQYSSKLPVFLDHGASGSMLITDDCKVCGIIWGFISQGNNNFAQFSIFDPNLKNFFQKYLH